MSAATASRMVTDMLFLSGDGRFDMRCLGRPCTGRDQASHHDQQRACRVVSTRVLPVPAPARTRSEEHTSELQSLMRISYAVFCLKKHKKKTKINYNQL